MKPTFKNLCAAWIVVSFMLSGSTPGFATPFIAPTEGLAPVSAIQQVRTNRVPRRTVRRSGNGFPAAVLGLFALGTAAAIASQHRNSYDCGYYNECGYDDDFYGGTNYVGPGRAFGGRSRGFVGGRSGFGGRSTGARHAGIGSRGGAGRGGHANGGRH